MYEVISKIQKGEVFVSDWHLHSTFSDGVLNPDKLALIAGGIGLRAIALTDHNRLTSSVVLDIARGALSKSRWNGRCSVFPGGEVSLSITDRRGEVRRGHLFFALPKITRAIEQDFRRLQDRRFIGDEFTDFLEDTEGFGGFAHLQQLGLHGFRYDTVRDFILQRLDKGKSIPLGFEKYSGTQIAVIPKFLRPRVRLLEKFLDENKNPILASMSNSDMHFPVTWFSGVNALAYNLVFADKDLLTDQDVFTQTRLAVKEKKVIPVYNNPTSGFTNSLREKGIFGVAEVAKILSLHYHKKIKHEFGVEGLYHELLASVGFTSFEELEFSEAMKKRVNTELVECVDKL